jgi:hypothetical protein
MKNSISLTVATLLLAVANVPAAPHYVSLESTNPTPPYTTWATADTNIQQAVDTAGPGAEIVVTNGVYAGGVAVTNPLALQSVNGPQFTVINGGGTNRCAYLASGASLSGFTLTNGVASGLHYLEGGGVYCESASAVLFNCVLSGNYALGRYPFTYSPGSGRGACGGTLNNCTSTGNSAGEGGGAVSSTINNCTFTGNSAHAYQTVWAPISSVLAAGRIRLGTQLRTAAGPMAARSTIASCISTPLRTPRTTTPGAP